MKRSTGILLGAIAALAASGSLLASSSPDGLNRVAADLGFSARQETVYSAPLPGYQVPHLPPAVSGAAAGLLGATVVGCLAWGAGKLLAKQPSA